VDPHTSQDMPLEHWGKVPSIFQHVHSATFPRMLINGIHGSQPLGCCRPGYGRLVHGGIITQRHNCKYPRERGAVRRGKACFPSSGGKHGFGEHSAYGHGAAEQNVGKYSWCWDGTSPQQGAFRSAASACWIIASA
jgi:hypothetical protein